MSNGGIFRGGATEVAGRIGVARVAKVPGSGERRGWERGRYRKDLKLFRTENRKTPWRPDRASRMFLTSTQERGRGRNGTGQAKLGRAASRVGPGRTVSGRGEAADIFIRSSAGNRVDMQRRSIMHAFSEFAFALSSDFSVVSDLYPSPPAILGTVA